MACVDSVLASSLPEFEIIVIDNASTDSSVEQFRQHFGDTVKIVENAENLGFAGGVNVGVQGALSEGAQSVLILNNDTIVDSRMLRHLISAAGRSPQTGIVGPVIRYYGQPERVWRFGDREYRCLPVPMRLPDSVLSKAGEKPFRVDYVTGCGMLVQRRVFETIGLFDTVHFMYFEDADFCRRAREAGFQILCAPQAQMWHKVSSSARKRKPAMRYAESWGRARFYRRHPHGCARVFTLAYLLAQSVRSTLEDLLSREWRLIKPQWIGMFDGYCDRSSRMEHFLS
jgi:GT2 family glycosyltransferase